MVTVEDIKWGFYDEYEGPYFKGNQYPQIVNASSSELDKLMTVLVATESGWAYDAVNMYDRMIVSIGLIQFGEMGQYSVSDMLGKVAEDCGVSVVLDPLSGSLNDSNATFKKNSLGKWRFFFNDERGEVNNVDKQRALFLGCSGRRVRQKNKSDHADSWTPELRVKAIRWAAALANVWSTPCARASQLDFVKKRLTWFLLPDAKKILFGKDAVGARAMALQAIYTSFAGNNPLIAKNALVTAVKESKAEKWSEAWSWTIMRHLVFDSKIAIYPARFDKIKPIVERLWNVRLPNSSSILFNWSEEKPSLLPSPSPSRSNVHVDDPPVPVEQKTTGNVSDDASGVVGRQGIIAFIVWLFALIASLFRKK